jgi:hypothetical protein
VAKIRLYPHRIAHAESVTWHPWWTERDSVRGQLPQVLTGWDYSSELTIGISLNINERALLSSTGLASIDEVDVLVTADCLAAQQRFVAHLSMHGQGAGTTIHVSLQLPGGQVANAVKLSAHLVCAHTAPERGDQVAHRRGARLHSSGTYIVRLEGDSGRFPTEAVPFSEAGYGKAPWTVLCHYNDLSDAFLGGVRLLVNTEHPAGQLVLNPTEQHRVANLMKADVIRLLVAKVAEQFEMADTSSFEEESVGYVLDGMCQLFLHQGLRDAVRLYREDLAEFEILLHNSLDPLAGVSG